jgi:2-dehydropantoate 2-reductase
MSAVSLSTQVQHTAAQLIVPATEAGQNFAPLFTGTDIRVTVTPDFVTAAWRKLCLNVAGSAITALTDRTLELQNFRGE